MVNKTEGIVNIHGKEYQTVAYRIGLFRETYGNAYSLLTEIIEVTANRVIMKAVIKNTDDRVIATGHAEEVRGSSNINKTSALENAETSAIGRCLASLGIGGTEFASANEVENAIHKQNQPFTPDQKLIFDQLIDTGDQAALELYIWLASLTDEARIGLHNSFEKGTITANKKEVSRLEKLGSASYAEYVAGIALALEEKDSGSLRELWDELGKAGAQLIWKDLNDEERVLAKTMLKGE